MIDLILRADRRSHQSADPAVRGLVVPSPSGASSDVRFGIALRNRRSNGEWEREGRARVSLGRDRFARK